MTIIPKFMLYYLCSSVSSNIFYYMDLLYLYAIRKFKIIFLGKDNIMFGFICTNTFAKQCWGYTINTYKNASSPKGCIQLDDFSKFVRKGLDMIVVLNIQLS